MPRTYIKVEYFQYIELKETVTVNEFAKKFGLGHAYASHWLSKWVGKGYLTLTPYDGEIVKTSRRSRGRPKGSHGRYRLGPKWWGDLVHGSELEFV